ncbi:MAG: PD40 domain-containing protein [Saprospiraceae bacterium]|nr:PD40 domain-containing protein [Saprospiraceae bacterium]
MKQFFPMLLLVAFFASQASGQTFKQYVKAADEEFKNLNYYAAMKHYQEAMYIEGERTEVLYKYAEAARLFESYTFADTAYTKVIAADTAKAYPLSKYWLATVMKKQGKYEQSQSFFQQFVDEHGASQPEYAAIAKQEIESLNWAIEAIKHPDENVTVERLGNDINTPLAEIAPQMKGTDLYYTSLSEQRSFKKGEAPRQYYVEMLAKNAKGKGKKLEFNDDNRHTAHADFTKDNLKIYYCLCDYVDDKAELRCEIWSRPVLGENKFGEPVKLPSSINVSGYTATDPMITYDETTGKDWLFFVSDRPGGLGKLDIWSAKLENDSTYSTLVNEAALNTPGNDVTPFYHHQSKTMYFASDGRQGFGGYDLYQANIDNGGWHDFEHMPAPFNSSYNDTHFWLNDSRTKGYFSSSRLGSLVLEPEFEACCNDLYAFTIQVLDLSVLTFNKKNNDPLEGVTIKMFELGKEGEILLTTVTNPTSNDFQFPLKKGTKYAMLATRPGFLPLREEVDLTLPAIANERTLERKLYLVPEKVDLHVSTFNKKNGNPLKGVEVRLVVDGQEVDFKKNEAGNNVDFVLDRGRNYQLIGSKVAYFSDTVNIDLKTDVTTSDIYKKLYLKPKEIEDFPPLVIYFDNDEPNPRTRKTTTEVSYKETWEKYMLRKDTFVSEYVTALEGMDSIISARRMDAFFEREVNNGYLSLEVFSENIFDIMGDGGFKVELIIQGFTSPRASEDYNFDLSQRRSDCLKNHFETWRGGALKPFVDKGMLTMQVVGYGEKLAPQFISDKLDDERGSIYSVVASFERKVAIIGARRVAEN